MQVTPGRRADDAAQILYRAVGRHSSEIVAAARTDTRGHPVRTFGLRILLVSLVAISASAAEPILRVNEGSVTRQFSVTDLLARSDVATIDVPHDTSYGHAMSYRAVPLRDLLADLPPDPDDRIEARASDGFVSQLPRAIIEGAAVPWVAVEDPRHPWPHLPGKTVSAGPFYLVWQSPEATGVSSEQWPYALAALTFVASPAQRWPAIAVGASLSPDAPARQGQAVFITNCLPCHKLGGNGEGTMGPDLLQPMPAVAYLTEPGLRALIRKPSSVRHWPAQQMPAFDATTIPDADIDAVVAYLRYLSARPR
jgi:mono/diheme cytochrome c family protein